jgi:hypothetical protein
LNKVAQKKSPTRINHCIALSTVRSFSNDTTIPTFTSGHSDAEKDMVIEKYTKEQEDIEKEDKHPVQNVQRPVKKKNNTFRKKKKPIHDPRPRLGTTTQWVKITGIPPLSTLDDMLVDIERIMSTELNMGIVNLDEAEKLLWNQMKNQRSQDEKGDDNNDDDNNNNNNNNATNNDDDASQAIPLWYPNQEGEDIDLPPHMVIEAHLDLSTLYRQAGWYLRFPNRSCVHALLSHVKEASRIARSREWENRSNKKSSVQSQDEEDTQDEPISSHEPKALKCGWKEVTVYPFAMKSKDFHSNIDWIDDSVVRVENCPVESTVDDLRYFLNLYTLMDDRSFDDNKSSLQAVQLAVHGTKSTDEKARIKEIGKKQYTRSRTNTFLVKFATASDARAAIREKQGNELIGRKIKLAQFSRQLIRK